VYREEYLWLVKCSEVKYNAVTGVKLGCTMMGIYGWRNWSEVKCSAVTGF